MSPQAWRARRACISRAADARERGAAPRGASAPTQPPGDARGSLRLPTRGATATGRVARVSEGGSVGSARCDCGAGDAFLGAQAAKWGTLAA